MALAASETAVEMREVVLRDKPAEMLVASPKGTVPVLALPDGKVIDESLDIMRWALTLNDPQGWLKGDDRTLIETNDGPFKHHLDRYKYSTRHAADPEMHRAAGMEFLQTLGGRLAQSKYLCGERPAMTDIAIFPFVRQFANTDRNWFDAQPIPNVLRWLKGWLESELFDQIMVKREQWKPKNSAAP